MFPTIDTDVTEDPVACWKFVRVKVKLYVASSSKAEGMVAFEENTLHE